MLELAELVKEAGEHLGYEVEIEHVENPRVEKEEHYYNAIHTKLLDLGLEPTLLGEELVESMIHIDRAPQGPRDRDARSTRAPAGTRRNRPPARQSGARCGRVGGPPLVASPVR